MEMDFFAGKNVHLIGIGGAGMLALAEILHDAGANITGSDCSSGKNTDRLIKSGIDLHIGHRPENIKGSDICIYSAAIPDDNAELIYAKSTIPTLSRADALCKITSDFDTVTAISGTHGKTTVSSMIAHTLSRAKKEVSWLIGGSFEPFNRNGFLKSNDLIIEACEYAETFLKLKRDNTVILNIDNDHLEYYGNKDNLKSAFEEFAKKSKTCFAFSGDISAVCCSQKAQNTITFGFLKNDRFRADNIQSKSQRHSFDIYVDGCKAGQIHLSILGHHNVINALAAFSVCHEVYKLPYEIIKNGLETFTGASRRFEILGTLDGITVADDYAHHPAEISATLSAAKNAGYNSITAVFQPFTFSRTKLLIDDFANGLKIADRVIICDIMGGRECFDPTINSKDLCDKIPNSVYRPDFDSAAITAVQLSSPGDLIITLGCGDIYKCANTILKNNLLSAKKIAN